MSWNPPDPGDREPKECVSLSDDCPEGCELAYTSQCPYWDGPEPLPFDDPPEDEWEEYPDDAPAGVMVPLRRPYVMREEEVRY